MGRDWFICLFWVWFLLFWELGFLPLSLCSRFQRIFIIPVDLIFMYVFWSSGFGNTPLL
jgi:hypothetical protein